MQNPNYVREYSNWRIFLKKFGGFFKENLVFFLNFYNHEFFYDK
jgi:hypothetical protein